MIEIQALAKNLNFKLLVKLEICKMIQFHQDAEYFHEPWVGRFKDRRLRSLYKDFAGERDDK